MADTSPKGYQERLLCNRKTDVDIFLQTPGNRLRVVARMHDDVHDMLIDMVVSQASLRIIDIHCEMVKVPDDVCRRALDFFQPLIGKRVAPGLNGQMKLSMHKGCTHMTNLFRQACYNLTLGQSVVGREELTAMFPEISDEQLYNIFLWFRPEIKNSCIRYAADSPFMDRLEHIEMPAGSEKLRAMAGKK